MKKSLVLMLSLVTVLSLAGCSPGSFNLETAPSEETKEAEAAQATAAVAETKYAEPKLIFKYGEIYGADNIITKVGYKFAEYVDEMSNGRIKIEVYPDAALGDVKTSFKALQEGGDNIDMFHAKTNLLYQYGFKKLNLFGLPYIFDSREGMWKVLNDEELGQAFLYEGSEMGAGMVGLFYTDEGARNLFTTKKINGIVDIENKKIRVPESCLMMDILSALSAQPIPMPYSELYSALQTGVVDGAENPMTAYLSEKYYELAPYYLLSEVTYSPGIVMMAENKWNALSDEDKKIFLDAGKKASEWNKNEIVKEEERVQKELEEMGVTFIEMSPEEKAKVRKDEEIVRVSYTPGLEELLTKIIEVQEQ